MSIADLLKTILAERGVEIPKINLPPVGDCELLGSDFSKRNIPEYWSTEDGLKKGVIRE